jgi:hypothetical protein
MMLGNRPITPEILTRTVRSLYENPPPGWSSIDFGDAPPEIQAILDTRFGDLRAEHVRAMRVWLATMSERLRKLDDL